MISWGLAGLALAADPLAPFLGPEPAADGDIPWPRVEIQGGVGVAIGATLDESRILIPFSPAVSILAEGGSPRARWVVGADMVPAFLWFGPQTEGIHFGSVTLGAAFGGSSLSIGPFATAGLLNAGLGVRTTWTPWPIEGGVRTGLETRLVWFAPGVGEVAVLYAFKGPERALRRGGARSGRPLCASFGLLAGVGGGVSSTEGRWEFVGSSHLYAGSASPALGAVCESSGPVRLALGLEMAPLFVYGVTDDAGTTRHAASHTVGLMLGTDALRIGPIAEAGIWIAGAGARLVAAPIQTRRGLRHGLDLRMLALAADRGAFEAFAFYGLWYDPRRSADAPPEEP